MPDHGMQLTRNSRTPGDAWPLFQCSLLARQQLADTA